jgi:hypothetical protein
MKLFLRILTAAAIAAATPAFADSPNTAVEASTSSVQGSLLMQSIAFLMLIGCTLAAVRFYSAIRGGRVGRGWLWIMWGFTVFAMSQLLILTGHFGFFAVPALWVDALRVVSLVLFFLGINQMRKVLA